MKNYILILICCWTCSSVSCQSYDSRLSSEAIGLIENNNQNAVNIAYIPLRRWFNQYYDNITILRYGLMYPELYNSLNITYTSIPGFNVSTTSLIGKKVTYSMMRIPVTIYVPNNYTQDRPIIVFLHGGGFIFDSRFSSHSSCAHMAQLLNVIVVNVEYRLAPEYRFPGGLEDSKRVVEYFGQNKLQLSPLAGNAKIGVMGASAGGNFASVIANELTKTKCDFLITAYALLNLLVPTPSNQEFNENFNFGKNNMGMSLSSVGRTLDTLYFNQSSDKTSTRFYAPSGVTPMSPPALLIAAELDALRDDSLVLLKGEYDSYGLTAIPYQVNGQIHGYFVQPDQCPLAFFETIGVIDNFLHNYI